MMPTCQAEAWALDRPLMDKPKRILPPVYFLAALVPMAGLHFFSPIAQILKPPHFYSGGFLIVGGVVVIIWAARLFERAGTTIKPFEESSMLVVGGPYRYSRNPMYLGMVFVLTGVGIVLGTLSPFAVIPVFIWLIQRRFIQPEEEMLETTLGPAYVEYKRRVRRWL